MRELFEKLLSEAEVPDWAIDQIERYLQSVPVEDANIDYVLDYVCSTKPAGAEWNDEIRSAVKAEIRAYGIE